MTTSILILLLSVNAFAADPAGYRRCFQALDQVATTMKSKDNDYARMLHRANAFGSGQAFLLGKPRTEGKEDVVDAYLIDWSKTPIRGVKKSIRLPSTSEMRTGGTASARLGTKLDYQVVLRNQPEQNGFDQRVSVRLARSSAFGLMTHGLSFASGGKESGAPLGPQEIEMDAAKMTPLSEKELEAALGERFETLSRDLDQRLGPARPCFQTGSAAFRERLSKINAGFSPEAAAPAPADDADGTR